MLHFSSPYPADERLWVVEPRRRPARAPPPFAEPRAGDRLALPGGASIDLREPYLGERLWVARPRMVGSVESYLGRRGRPIRYAYAAGDWGLDAYQTIFGIEPGSAEMPSAGRPFTSRTLAALAARGVRVVPIVLHSGVSSLEDGESPLPERFAVSQAAAARVNARPRSRRPGRRDRDDSRPRARVGRRRRRQVHARGGLDGRRHRPGPAGDRGRRPAHRLARARRQPPRHDRGDRRIERSRPVRTRPPSPAATCGTSSATST